MGGASATPEEIEMFIQQNNIDDRAAHTLRSSPPQISRIVIDRGTLAECSNPNSALIGRIRDARQQVHCLGQGMQSGGGGGGGGMMGGGMGMGASLSPALANVAVDPMEVQQFCSTNALDERATSSLLRCEPAVQRQVMDRGSMHELANPSAAIGGRIRDAKKALGLNVMVPPSGCMAGGCMGGGAAMGGGMGGGCGDGGAQQQLGMQAEQLNQQLQLIQMQIQQAQQFSGIPQGVEMMQNLMLQYQDLQNKAMMMQQQQQTMQQGMGGCMGGCMGGQAGGGGGMAMMQQQQQQQQGSPEVEAFLAQNRVDDRCATSFRQLPGHLQQAVMSRGNLVDCTNPSSALVGRIRDARAQNRANPY